MADAAKVIRGLEFCLKVACQASSGEKCPYIGSGGADGCIYEMQSDALKLLKKQEPKQVISLADSIEEMTVGYCPSCGEGIANKMSKPTKFCRYCGQAVK